MRHRKSGRKLGRNSTHRKAMFSNMVAALVRNERIETTEAKAKELRSVAEKTINWGVSVSPLYQKGLDKLKPEERIQIVHAQRMARRVLKDTEMLHKLFSELAPRFVGRPGGYTRILKTRTRTGDAAPMAFIELVKEPMKAKKKATKKSTKAAASKSTESEDKPKKSTKKAEASE